MIYFDHIYSSRWGSKDPSETTPNMKFQQSNAHNPLIRGLQVLTVLNTKSSHWIQRSNPHRSMQTPCDPY